VCLLVAFCCLGSICSNQLKMVKSPIIELSDMANTERISTDSHLGESYDPKSTIEEERESFDFNSDMIFDSIAVQFNSSVFFSQLLANTFIIFAPYVTNVRGQGFVCDFPRSCFPFVVNVIFPLLVYLMIASYYMMDTTDEYILSGALWMPIIYFVQHKLIVALKYASLSDTEYKRFMSCKDFTTCSIYQSQMQLLAAWLDRDETVLEFELGDSNKSSILLFHISTFNHLITGAAAARVGAKINDIHIAVQSPAVSESSQSQFRNWNAFIR
jgi:hypothetical protein